MNLYFTIAIRMRSEMSPSLSLLRPLNPTQLLPLSLSKTKNLQSIHRSFVFFDKAPDPVIG